MQREEITCTDTAQPRGRSHALILLIYNILYFLVQYNNNKIVMLNTSRESIQLSDYPCLCRKDLFKQFGIDLSFVATRSGLTRWEEHKEKDEFADEEDSYDPDNPPDP